ncbi:hypothetical protein E4U42_003201 [Claviceps africana]|uniref:Uncharacterized protein n=1 Tax=Claviceps africana TaxID=83212 RepID=A0A8K0JCS7_9HYPO|nr:hypothetical protein E4U42_003201 [Claviceps africana]
MGNCQSCLGRRDHHDYEEDEETCLLYDDGHGMQYGSFDDQYLGGDETVESLREHDALQQVIARTSNSMVDVFEIEPHYAFGHVGTFIPSPHAERGSRATRCHNLASKLSGKDGSVPQKIEIDWLVHDGDGGHHGYHGHRGRHGRHAHANIKMQSNRPASSIKTLDNQNSGTLVGTFADAAAAME